jgi:hypothetical protein
MHPIEAIQNYKAGQQLKAALKPVAKSSIGATEIGFDANQGKAVIATEDGGQLYTESITNGYRGPGQAVRIDRDGSVIVSDSMPRPKTPEIKTETPILYRKLQILYITGSGNKIAYYVGGFQRKPIKVGTIGDGWQAASLENNGLADFTVGFYRYTNGGYERRFLRWKKGVMSKVYQADYKTPENWHPFPTLESVYLLENDTPAATGPNLFPRISGAKNTSKWGGVPTSYIVDNRIQGGIGLNDSSQEAILPPFWLGKDNDRDSLILQKNNTYFDDPNDGLQTFRSTEDALLTGTVSILPSVKRDFYFNRNILDDRLVFPAISLLSQTTNLTQRLIHSIDLSTALVIRCNWVMDFDGGRDPNLIRNPKNAISLIDSDGLETAFPETLKISDLQAFVPGEGANAKNETTAAPSILDFWNLHKAQLYTFNPTTETVAIWNAESTTPKTIKPPYYPPQKKAHILSAQYRP